MTIAGCEATNDVGGARCELDAGHAGMHRAWWVLAHDVTVIDEWGSDTRMREELSAPDSSSSGATKDAAKESGRVGVSGRG